MDWSYAQYEYLLSASLLICAMFGMGATLTARDFQAVVRAPQGVLLVLGMQVLITPLLAVLLTRGLLLPPEIGVGLLVSAALPGGLFSNIFAYLGRGNVALSVSATAVCTLGSLITTTIVLRVFGAAQLPPGFSMPVRHVLVEISLCLLLPLLLGMGFRRVAPQRAPQVANYCVLASTVMLLLVILAAVGSGRVRAFAYGWRPYAALIGMQALLLWISYGFSTLLKLSKADTFTIAIEVLVRNSHLGVLLKAALFPASDPKVRDYGDAVLFCVLVYGMICMCIAVGEVIGKRRGWGFYGRRTGSDAPPADEAAAAERAAAEGAADKPSAAEPPA